MAQSVRKQFLNIGPPRMIVSTTVILSDMSSLVLLTPLIVDTNQLGLGQPKGWHNRFS
jgi:hypothetical protein